MQKRFHNLQTSPKERPSFFPDWTGETVCIVASGPSASSIDLKSIEGKVRFIAINESWRLCPWADVLYGCDDAYWKAKKGVPEFKGLKLTTDRRASARFSDVHLVALKRPCEEIITNEWAVGWGGNSGFHSLNLSLHFNVARILLVGFDMQLNGGIHWHGRHPYSMNNPTATNVDRWRRVVDAAAPVFASKNIFVANLSPVSALQNYPKMSLDEAMVPRMKILVAGPELKTVTEVKNFSGVYSYYLRQEFLKRRCTLDFISKPDKNTALEFYKSLPLKNYDHFLALGSRHLERMPREVSKYLNSKISGGVGQFNDRNIWRPNAPLTFIVKGSNTHSNKVIGWAADPELCYPRQSRSVLRILVDHPDYVKDRGDITGDVLAQVDQFVKSRIWNQLYNDIEVVRWADGGVTTNMGSINGFHREHMPFDKACEEYSKAHIFMVTHPESVGLSTLETCMAGALPLIPEGFIAKELLRTIRHLEYKTSINWVEVLREINVNASRKKALENSWSKVADRVLVGLKEFRH